MRRELDDTACRIVLSQMIGSHFAHYVGAPAAGVITATGAPSVDIEPISVFDLLRDGAVALAQFIEEQNVYRSAISDLAVPAD